LLKEQLISHLKPRYFAPKGCTFVRLSPLLFHLNTSFYKIKAMLLPHFLFLFSHKTNPRIKQNQQKNIFLFASSCRSRAIFISKQTLTKADQHARLTNEYYLQKTTRKLFFLYICAIIVPQIETNEAQK